MAKPWLRLYRDAINKPKFGRLDMEGRGFWVSCLMMSDDTGLLPPAPDIQWVLRTDIVYVEAMLAALERHGLVTRDSHGGVTVYRLHDWDEHQHASDADPTARERKQRQREREKAQKSAATRDVTHGHGISHASVTRTDTDTDTDTDKKKEEARKQDCAPTSSKSPEPVTLGKYDVEIQVGPEPRVASRTKASKRGTRWPDDAVVPEDWISDGETYREVACRPPTDLRAEALKFANYWASKSGGSATKIDWKRTWLNWCLTANGGLNGSRTHGKSQLEQLADIIAADQVIDG